MISSTSSEGVSRSFKSASWVRTLTSTHTFTDRLVTPPVGEDDEKNSAFHSKDNHNKLVRKKSIAFNSAFMLESQMQFQIIIRGEALRVILNDAAYLK